MISDNPDKFFCQIIPPPNISISTHIYTGQISRRGAVLLLRAYKLNKLNRITLSDAMFLLDLGYSIALATLQELTATGILTKAKKGGIYMGFLDPKEAGNLEKQLFFTENTPKNQENNPNGA